MNEIKKNDARHMIFWAPLTIARTLSIILIGAFSCFGLVVALCTESALESRFGDIQQKDFERRMQSHASLLYQFMDMHIGLVGDLARDEVFVQSVMNPDAMKENLRDYISKLRIMGKQVQITLLDYEGKTIQSSQSYPVFNYQSELWIADMIKGKKSSHFSTHQQNNDYFLTFARVVEYNGQPEGILLTEIPANTLATSYHWSDMTGNEQLKIFYINNDESGNNSIKKISMTEHDHPDDEKSSILFFPHHDHGDHLAFTRNGEDGALHLSRDNSGLILSLGPDILNSPNSSIDMPEYGLQLVGYLDNSSLIKTSHSILDNLLITVFILALATVTIIFFLSRKLFIDPIIDLRKITTQIASGQLSHAQKSEKDSSPLFFHYRLQEISDLAADVLSMAKTITAREKSLQNANNMLEQLVLERTSELQAARDTALRASRAKSSFLAAMSHEIRTPMNAVLGILGLLKETPLSGQQLKIVQSGRESGELLMNIINDILDFSKMEAGKIQMENSTFDIHHLFDVTIELLRPQAENKGLDINLELDEHLPQYAKGDPGRLRQILINLVNNAIKFTLNGYVSIHVKVCVQNGSTFTLQCCVEDTGIGISGEFQAVLFDEFSMVDQSYSRSHEGTGLGLAICKRLTALMGGDIGVTSKSGAGSRFTFTVKLQSANQKECHFKTIDEGLDPEPGTRILLAEDNPANQMVIKAVLERSGLQVDTVANGKEAVDVVGSLPYDIVLMDISMPEMDGIEATRNIRQLPGMLKNIPIIALTAHALSGDKERFMKAGLNDYLTKPINREEVLNCIARWSTGEHIPSKNVLSNQSASSFSVEGEYVDEGVLDQLVKDTSVDIAAELLVLYIDDTKKRLALIDTAVDTHDLKQLELETPSLGSSAAAHGNLKLHHQAHKVELLCKSANHSQALSEAAQLTAVAVESLRLLNHHLEGGFVRNKS